MIKKDNHQPVSKSLFLKENKDFYAKMATKEDFNLILKRIDTVFGRLVDVFEKKVLVHDYRLNELEAKVGR